MNSEVGIDVIQIPQGWQAKLLRVNRDRGTYVHLWTSPVYDEEQIARAAGLRYAREHDIEVMFRWTDSSDGIPVPSRGY